MGGCAGSLGLDGALRRRSRAGRPPPTGVGHHGRGTADTGRGGQRVGGRRPGHRRESLFASPEPGAAAVVAAACAGRPTVLHHHDLPWQRPQFADLPPPPDDPAWAHVTINALSRAELAEYGIVATTLYNSFDPDPAPGDGPASARSRGSRRDAAPAAAHPCARTQEHRRPPSPSPRQRAPPTGSSAPPRTATGRSWTDSSPRRAVAFCSAPRSGAPLPTPTRHATSWPAPLALGGLRQSVGGVGDIPPAAGHRPVPGGGGAGGLRFRVVRRGRPRPLGALARATGRRPDRPQPAGGGGRTSTWPTCRHACRLVLRASFCSL